MSSRPRPATEKRRFVREPKSDASAVVVENTDSSPWRIESLRWALSAFTSQPYSVSSRAWTRMAAQQAGQCNQ